MYLSEGNEQQSGNVLKINKPIQKSIQDKRTGIRLKGFIIQRGVVKFLRSYLMQEMGEKYLHRFKRVEFILI